jgi:hypothetical protein
LPITGGKPEKYPESFDDPKDEVYRYLKVYPAKTPVLQTDHRGDMVVISHL